MSGNISVAVQYTTVDARGEGRREGERIGKRRAACRLLAWTQGGITDYSLSRPICQAARTTRSQALYCKIKWLACGARRYMRTTSNYAALLSAHLFPVHDSGVKYRWCAGQNVHDVRIIGTFVEELCIFHIERSPNRMQSKARGVVNRLRRNYRRRAGRGMRRDILKIRLNRTTELMNFNVSALQY